MLMGLVKALVYRVREVMVMIVVRVILNASKSSYVLGIHCPFYISIYSMLS